MAATLLTVGGTAEPEAQAVFKEFLTQHPPGSKTALKAIQVFQVEKMHNSNFKRLISKMRPKYCTLEGLVVKAIEQYESTEEFSGKKPAGYLELAGQSAIKKD